MQKQNWKKLAGKLYDKQLQEKKDKRILELIQAVAGKLLAEGLSPWNFDKNKAMEKLSQVVAPNVCLKILVNFETEVKEAMVEMKAKSREP